MIDIAAIEKAVIVYQTALKAEDVVQATVTAAEAAITNATIARNKARDDLVKAQAVSADAKAKMDAVIIAQVKAK